jgi:hypothetical protein
MWRITSKADRTFMPLQYVGCAMILKTSHRATSITSKGKVMITAASRPDPADRGREREMQHTRVISADDA